MRFAKRVTYLIPVLAITLAACSGAQASQVADKDSDFYVALPRVVVDIDDQGMPSIAGITPDMIKSLSLGTVDLSQYAVPKDWLDYLKSTNTQHVELGFNGDGAFIYANGKQLPHIALSDESVNGVGEVVGTLAPAFIDPAYAGYIPFVQKFLPLARRLGLNLVVRLPRSAGAGEIPLRDPSAPAAASPAKTGDGAVQVRTVITYDENGVPSIAGISASDLEQLTGYDMYMLKLDPAFVKLLQDRGIQHISMRSEGDGLALAVNDKPLPSLVCSADCLKNSSELIGTLNTYPGMEQINELVQKFGPELTNVNAELALRFPPAPGSQRIPLPFGSVN
jgi:hypothetical protein